VSEDPFESLETTISTHVRDWAADERDAWVWGIVLGWDAASMHELATKFGWTAFTVARLRRLRQKFMIARRSLSGKKRR
jgi:hypothetical protein